MVDPGMSEVEGITCVVTGATSGIGRVTALELARMGARVVLVSRTRERGRQTLMEICRDTGRTQVDLLVADLSSREDVRRLAGELTVRYPQIDVLVNNAGAIFTRRQESVDGVEMTLALNHLGYFHLTTLLLDTLRRSAPCRVINVASEAHRGARLDLDDLQLARRYSGWRAYANSKLCNLLFTYELARRVEGTGIAVHAVHPGTIASGFGRNTPGFFRSLVRLGSPFMGTPEKGARTVIHLATAPDVADAPAAYWISDRIRRSSAASRHPETAARLWALSEELVAAGS